MLLKKLYKYLFVSRISLSNNLVYVENFIVRNFFLVFIIYIMLMLWQNIYGQKGDVIAGLSLRQMIWYLIVTEIITLSRSDVFNEVSVDVKNGNIAYMLNKPYSYVFYCFSNSLGEIGVKLITNATIGLIIGVLYVGPLIEFKLTQLPFVVLSILLGICINFFIHICLSLTSFWVEENSAFYWIYSKLVFTLGGMLIPIEMFPEWIERLARRLPFAYITYGPARLVVDFSLSNFASVLAFQLGYLLIFIGLSTFIYRKGVRALNVNGG